MTRSLGQWTFFYDTRSNLKATQYPNGTFSWSDLNAAGWQTALYNRHGTLSAPLPGSVPSDPSSIADYAYSYELEGRKTQEVRSGGGLTTETSAYLYDDLGRLKQVTLPDATVRVYSFDLDSNRTQITENGQTTATYAYDPTKLDQLQSVTQGGTTTYGYDGDGNTTGRGSDPLSWDGRGRHAGGSFAGTTVSYGFDAAGFRRLRTGGASTTNYRLSGLYETSSQGTITNTDTAGPAGDLAHYAGPPTTGSTVSFLYYSGHGDLAAEANTSGTRTAAYTYDPFGQLRSGSAPANATSERWTGRFDKKLDSQSSLIEMGARPYDPSLGRFLAVDPMEGGSLNSCDFAGQDPINTPDLSGLKKPDIKQFDDAIRECERQLRKNGVLRAKEKLKAWQRDMVKQEIESMKLSGQKKVPFDVIVNVCLDFFDDDDPTPPGLPPDGPVVVPPLPPLLLIGGLEKAL